MKKKLLLISYFFPPLNAIGSLRPFSFARYLAKNHDFDVTVLTIKKIAREDDLKFDLSAEPFRIVEIEDKSLIKPKYVREKENNPWKKKVRMALSGIVANSVGSLFSETDSWFIPAFRKAKALHDANNFDVIVSSFFPISAHLIPLCLKLQKKEFLWVADYRDLWTFNHQFNKPVFPLNLFQLYIESRINKSANCITTVSDGLKDLLEEKFKTKVTVIENGYFPEDLLPPMADRIKIDNGKIILLYAGVLYKGKRDPSPLFQAVKELLDDGLLDKKNFLIAFYGPDSHTLQEMVQKFGVDEVVSLHPQVSREKVLELQNSSTALLQIERENDDEIKLLKGNMTTKIFEYLITQKPIIAVGVTNRVASGDLIERANAGYVCGYDVPLIKNAILEVCKGSRKVTDLQVVSMYDREKLCRKLAFLIEGKLSTIDASKNKSANSAASQIL